MDRRMLRLVLLISMAHTMVHTYELVFSGVEQRLALAWGLSVRTIGLLAAAWALPFGLGALGAGWLADRVGSRIVLIVYLIGASAACLGVGWAGSLPLLFVAMFVMGSFASLYHPAGLAYISHVVPRSNLGAALGYHGILGSIGIAGAPFLAGSILLAVPDWNFVYLVLAPAGLLLALWFAWSLPADALVRTEDPDAPSEPTDWLGFGMICIVTMLFGMIYRGFTTFLPRYLSDVLPWESAGSYLSSLVLLVGILGQSLGGWLCGRFGLERLLLGCMALNVPFLIALGWADRWLKLGLVAVYAIVHFLMQPVSNSLIAHYTPRRRRSLGYGFNFLVSFGVGSVGGWYAGYLADRFGVWAIYPGLAALAALAAGAGLAVVLRWQRRQLEAAPIRFAADRTEPQTADARP